MLDPKCSVFLLSETSCFFSDPPWDTACLKDHGFDAIGVKDTLGSLGCFFPYCTCTSFCHLNYFILYSYRIPQVYFLTRPRRPNRRFFLFFISCRSLSFEQPESRLHWRIKNVHSVTWHAAYVPSSCVCCMPEILLICQFGCLNLILIR